jgi:membrane protein implicated in regulation of membrane protease activity
MDARDAFFAASSFAIILLIALAAVLTVAFLFTLGSPLLLFGGLAALGLLAIPLLVGALAFFIGLWYIIYALMKEYSSKKEPEKKGGNYTLERIRKA